MANAKSLSIPPLSFTQSGSALGSDRNASFPSDTDPDLDPDPDPDLDLGPDLTPAGACFAADAPLISVVAAAARCCLGL